MKENLLLKLKTKPALHLETGPACPLIHFVHSCSQYKRVQSIVFYIQNHKTIKRKNTQFQLNYFREWIHFTHGGNILFKIRNPCATNRGHRDKLRMILLQRKCAQYSRAISAKNALKAHTRLECMRPCPLISGVNNTPTVLGGLQRLWRCTEWHMPFSADPGTEMSGLLGCKTGQLVPDLSRGTQGVTGTLSVFGERCTPLIPHGEKNGEQN